MAGKHLSANFAKKIFATTLPGIRRYFRSELAVMQSSGDVQVF
jgi:hypothetical protein